MDRGASSVIWRDTSSRTALIFAKHPRHEEALLGVKTSRARLIKEETMPSTFTTKKVKTMPDE